MAGRPEQEVPDLVRGGATNQLPYPGAGSLSERLHAIRIDRCQHAVATVHQR